MRRLKQAPGGAHQPRRAGTPWPRADRHPRCQGRPRLRHPRSKQGPEVWQDPDLAETLKCTALPCGTVRQGGGIEGLIFGLLAGIMEAGGGGDDPLAKAHGLVGSDGARGGRSPGRHRAP